MLMPGLRVLGVALAFLTLVGAQPDKSVRLIEASDDSWVVTNLADEKDSERIRETVLGTQDFTRAWYAWNVVGSEQVFAVGLVRFDLSSVKDQSIASSHLQLYASRTSLKPQPRLVDVYLVEGTWSESAVTYNSRPPWGVNPIATTAVYGPNTWYSWDVTSAVAATAKRDGYVSFAYSLRDVDAQSEEQILFAARELGANGPRLIVTYDTPPGLPVDVILGGVAGALLLVVVAFLLGRYLARHSRHAPPASPPAPDPVTDAPTQ